MDSIKTDKTQTPPHSNKKSASMQGTHKGRLFTRGRIFNFIRKIFIKKSLWQIFSCNRPEGAELIAI